MELKSVEFWVAVAVAILVKVRTSEQLTWAGAAFTIAVAAGAAYSLSGPVSSYLNAHETLVAALLALMADGIMRWLIRMADQPARLLKLLKEWKQ